MNDNDFYGNNSQPGSQPESSSGYQTGYQGGYSGGYQGGYNGGYQTGGYNGGYQTGGYGSGNNNNNRRKRGKGWLIAVLIVLGVVVVSALSIGIYSIAAGTNNKVESGTIEIPAESSQEEPDEQTPDEPEQQDGKQEEIAKEGTSEEYDLTPSSVAGTNEMTPEQVSDAVIPSVVCIQNYREVYYQQQGYYGFGVRQSPGEDQTSELELYGEGSGIIITEDGYIATNAHVAADADLLKVVLSNDEIYEAKLVGIDTDTDLAVLKIEATGLQKATLGNSDELSVGQYVMAIGNPGGLNFSSSVTLGIVSSKDRPLQLDDNGYTMNTIQTDAAINPGNSGGALVNLSGQVVGISSAKYVATGYEGLGFAITINEALPIIQDLMDYGKVQNRSMLGITGQMLDSVTAEYYDLVEGFYVYSVTSSDAGTLQAGDVITKVEDTEIKDGASIKDVIKGLAPGSVIRVEYYRSADSKTYTTEITLVKYSEED